MLPPAVSRRGLVDSSNVSVPLQRAVVHFFFFNDTATTEIYTLSLHDALPISGSYSNGLTAARAVRSLTRSVIPQNSGSVAGDRKSTRLNSSHGYISYAVFCLKKKTMHRGRIARGSRTAETVPLSMSARPYAPT